MARLETLHDVVRFCSRLNLPADVVGRWVWIRFTDKPSATILAEIKAAGFRWVQGRGEWAHNCGANTGRGRCVPRWKYGEVPVQSAARALDETQAA